MAGLCHAMFDLLIPLTVFQRLGVTHQASLLESPKEGLRKLLWVNPLSNVKARRGPRTGQRYAKVSQWPVANVGQHPAHLACHRSAYVSKEQGIVSTCYAWLRAQGDGPDGHSSCPQGTYSPTDQLHALRYRATCPGFRGRAVTHSPGPNFSPMP